MNLLFNLSGEHPHLPKAEVLAVLEGEKIKNRVLSENPETRVMVVEVETEDPSFIKRLALTKRVGEFIGVSESLSDLAKKAYERLEKGTFAVDGKKELREDLGERIWKLGFEVDLINPDSRILCFEEEGKYSIAIETPVEKDFDQRKPQHRPYFHPTSLSPKIARVLVNLARVRKGDAVLDPFCGTGGILIEAGLMGMEVFGCDFSQEMVEGCQMNLEHYGIKGRTERCDALNLGGGVREVDAIVTDPPYGRSSFLTDKNIERFYSDYMSSAAKVLEPGKHMVLVVPDKVDLALDEKEFSLRETHSVYVHKSLTRKILVLKKT